MAKRTDEWNIDKHGLDYCAKHERYYLTKIGCQLCGYDNVNNKHPEKTVLPSEAPNLIECKVCKKLSLMWNSKAALFQCLNVKCNKYFAYEEIEYNKLSPAKKVNQIEDTKEMPYLGTISRINNWLKSK